MLRPLKTYQSQYNPPKDCACTTAQAALEKRFFLQVVCFVVIILVILFPLNIQKEAFSVAEGADFARSGLPVKYVLSPVYTTAQCLFKHEPKLSCVRGTSTWQRQPSSSAAGTHEQNCSLSYTHSQGGSMKPSPKFRSHHPKAVRETIHHDDSSSM